MNIEYRIGNSYLTHSHLNSKVPPKLAAPTVVSVSDHGSFMLSVTQPETFASLSPLSPLLVFTSLQILSVPFSLYIRNLSMIITPTATIAALVLVILLLVPGLCFCDFLLLHVLPAVTSQHCSQAGSVLTAMSLSVQNPPRASPNEGHILDVLTAPLLTLPGPLFYHPPPSLTLLPQKLPSHFPDCALCTFKDSHPNSSHLLCFTLFF